MSDSTTNKPNPDADGGPNPAPGNNPVSAKKVEANRKNAQKSTGPRTETGKAQAAGNAFKHGFYAQKLFPTPEHVAKDQADYLTVAKGFHAHYQPVGYVENLWVEKIATQVLRSARLLAHEQKVLSWAAPFEERSVSNLLRYQTSVNRELAWAIEELERLQELRKAGPNTAEPSDSNEGEQYEPEQPAGGPLEPDGEPSADLSTSFAPAAAEGGGERPEGAPSGSAKHESCGTNPTAAETNCPATTKTQDRGGHVAQNPEPSAESRPSSTDKNDETNPRKSLADCVTEVFNDDNFPY